MSRIKHSPPTAEQIAAWDKQAKEVTAMAHAHVTEMRAQQYAWRAQRLAKPGDRIEINSTDDERNLA